MPQDPWAEFRVGGPAAPPPQAPQAPGVIYGAPDPYKAAENARADTSTAIQLENLRLAQEREAREREKAERERQEAAEREQRQAQGLKDSTHQIFNVIRTARKAKKLSRDGLFATGLGAATTGEFGGTPAADMRSLLTTIGSNTAFDRLQKMRDESPTGGALGQVAVPELEMLRDSIASLNPSQSDTQFQDNMDVVINSYLRVLEKLDPQAAAQLRAEIEAEDKAAQGGIPGYSEEQGLMPVVTDDSPRDPSGGGGRYSLNNIALALGQGAGSIVEGVAALPGMVINPVGQALYDALGYNQTYDAGSIVREGLGLPDNPNQLNDAIIQGAAAGITGGLGARSLATISNPGVMQNAFNALAATPVRDTVAGASAAAGSYAAQDYGPIAQTGAGIVAGGLGYGGASTLTRAPRGVDPVLGAMQRQNVDLLPADTGGMTARGLTTAAKASPFSAAPVVDAAKRSQDQMGRAASRIANSQGDVVTTDVAGGNIRNAAERFSRESSERGGKMYTKAYKLAEGARIVPAKTIAKLDERIARLQANPAASEGSVAELQRFRDNLTNGVGIEGLRDARTTLSQGTYDGKLRSNAEKQMWKEILGDLSSDINEGLREQGKDQAADLFQRADDYWSARVDHIDSVLQPLLGRDKGGEQIVQAVESMARGQSGGGVRLSKLLSQMTPEEAGQVRATIVDRMGKATPGAQDAAGETFSASTFLTNWNKMTPQAKASLFSNTKLRNDLNDLALLAERSKATQAAANHSNTGMALYGNVGAQGYLFVNHPVLAMSGMAAQYLTGRMLASPGVARALARSAKMPPAAGKRTLVQQLGAIALREPAIEQDIKAFTQALNDNMATSAAANEQDKEQR